MFPLHDAFECRDCGISSSDLLILVTQPCKEVPHDLDKPCVMPASSEVKRALDLGSVNPADPKLEGILQQEEAMLLEEEARLIEQERLLREQEQLYQLELDLALAESLAAEEKSKLLSTVSASSNEMPGARGFSAASITL